MINLRYHIVSITAVFLALGIGVMLGGTYLDKYTVDQLDKNITDAERRIAETSAENRSLTKDVGDAQARDLALLANGRDRLLDGLLPDQKVLVVVGPGVDSSAADGVRLAVRSAGAELRGTLVLRDRMLFDQGFDSELAADLDTTAKTQVALRNTVNRQLVAALDAADEPVTPGSPDTTVPADPDSSTTTAPASEPTAPTTAAEPPPADGVTTTTTAPGGDAPPDGTQPEIVTSLVKRGYATVEPGPGRVATDPILESGGYRYVFVSGYGLTQAESDAMVRLLPTDPTKALEAVAVNESQPDEPDAARLTLVQRVRADDSLEALYSTVDNSNTFSGLVATVFVLADLPDASPGQFGQGPGAQGVLPAES